MKRLKRKVCVVTGGSMGIGEATCRAMVSEGAKVAIADVVDKPGKVLARQLGQDASYWHMDVSSEASVKATISKIAKFYGRIDVLVNNAGISGVSKPTHEVTESEWDAVQAVNVKGVFFCTKYTLPHMIKAGGGSIINLSSIYGLVGAPDVPPYHASKGAVRLMTKTDALLYAKQGIRVNSVHPGFIRTPMLESGIKKLGDPKEVEKAMITNTPLGRIGAPEDIAQGIVYLASDDSKFVTGSELVIDGGYSCK